MLGIGPETSHWPSGTKWLAGCRNAPVSTLPSTAKQEEDLVWYHQPACAGFCHHQGAGHWKGWNLAWSRCLSLFGKPPKEWNRRAGRRDTVSKTVVVDHAPHCQAEDRAAVLSQRHALLSSSRQAKRRKLVHVAQNPSSGGPRC